VSELDLDDVLRRSGTLEDRVAGLARGRRQIALRPSTSSEVARHRLGSWSERLTVDGTNYFPKRLAAGSLTFSDAAEACSPELVYDCRETSWLEPFVAALARWEDRCGADENIPFVHLLGGFVAAGEAALVALDAGGGWTRLSEPAQQSCKEVLLRRLSDMLKWCLYFSFAATRRTRPRTDAYESFVSAASSRDWASDFFVRFAGLVRPVGTAIMQWAQAIVEVLARWEADREDVAPCLGFSPNAKIASIATAGSDLHNHGRGVIFLDLTDGSRVVYKPTPGALTELWARAQEVAWGCVEPSPAVVRGDGYSWHRFLTDDRTGEQTHSGQSYFEHLGKLLALATLLGACDLHYENFVPHAGAPQLVDHETVLTPTVRLGRSPGTGALRAAIGDLYRSVLATGALPQWLDGPEGELWTVDAFGLAMRDHAGGSPVLSHVNTGAMSISRASSNGSGSGPPILSRAHVGDPLARGFSEGWRAVMSSRSKLQSLVNDFEADVRVVLRDTRYYTQLMTEGYMPRYSCDVLDRSLLFERLYRPFLQQAPSPEKTWRLCRLEHDALIRGDIPYFLTEPNKLDLREGGATDRALVRLSGASPASHAARNIRESRPDDGPRNVALIRSAIEIADWPATTVRDVPHAFKTRVRATDDWRSRLGVARELFDHTRRAAYSHRDGSVAQIGPHPDRHGRAQVIGVLSATDTYSGISGLGLLAAALSRCSDSPVYSDWARRVADTLVTAAIDLKGRDCAGQCGAFAGAAGVAFVIAKIGTLLGAPEYEDAARAVLLAHGADHEEKSQPGEFDVISGWAGICMVASALAPGSDEDGSIRGYVRRAADCLIAAAVTDGEQSRCWWPSRSPAGVSGFAHGSAGIAAALARVHRAGVVDAADVVGGAFANEGSLFDPSSETWPIGDADDRDKRERASNVWCYGSGGLLLAVAEAYPIHGLATAPLLERAVRATLKSEPDGDGLCHGATGLALCELRSGRLLGDEQLVASGRERLTAVANRCLTDNSLRLEPATALEHDGGLMCGATGVGFALVAAEAGPEAVDLLAIA
jgi:type 2 lantibiotic biosynthesis protein LanM